MNVLAFATPSRPDWRWRIVNLAGEVVEESFQTFLSIADAVKEGTRRMDELNAEDLSKHSSTLYRNNSYLRSR